MSVPARSPPPNPPLGYTPRMLPRAVATLTLDELTARPLPTTDLSAEIIGALDVAARTRAKASGRTATTNARTAYGGAMFALILISAAALRRTRDDHPALERARHKSLAQLATPHTDTHPATLALQVLEAALTARAHAHHTPRDLDPDTPGYLRQDHDPKPWLALAALAYASGRAHHGDDWHVLLP